MNLSGYYNAVTYLYRVCRITKSNFSFRRMANGIIYNTQFNDLSRVMQILGLGISV